MGELGARQEGSEQRDYHYAHELMLEAQVKEMEEKNRKL